MAIVNLFRMFISIDDSTACGRSFEEARSHVCIDFNYNILESVELVIDGKVYRLAIKEEFSIPYYSHFRKHIFSDCFDSSESLNSEDFWSWGLYPKAESGKSNDSRDNIVEFESEKAGTGSAEPCRPSANSVIQGG